MTTTLTHYVFVFLTRHIITENALVVRLKFKHANIFELLHWSLVFRTLPFFLLKRTVNTSQGP